MSFAAAAMRFAARRGTARSRDCRCAAADRGARAISDSRRAAVARRSAHRRRCGCPCCGTVWQRSCVALREVQVGAGAHRPCELARVEALREQRLDLAVDELEALGVATDEEDAVTRVYPEAGEGAGLSLDHHRPVGPAAPPRGTGSKSAPQARSTDVAVRPGQAWQPGTEDEPPSAASALRSSNHHPHSSASHCRSPPRRAAAVAAERVSRCREQGAPPEAAVALRPWSVAELEGGLT
jgi:hypothetical protein